jgi:hypothetical protein
VSLINEALRKARQAASEHDSKQAEGPSRPARAYPSRRSGSPNSLLIVALTAVAAGAIVASAVWWFFGSRQTVQQPAVASHQAPVAAASVAETPSPIPEPDDNQAILAPVQADVAEVSAPRPTAAPEPTPPIDETDAEPAPPAEAPGEPAPRSDGERVFVVEADLGATSLSLGYIVARRDNPFAEINGVEVYVGSEIEGFVVEAIEADRVVLRDDQGELILRVP